MPKRIPDKFSQHDVEEEQSTELYIQMGLRLRKFRREKDYTQEKMAEILGISPAYYGKIERGINSLSIKRLKILHDKLGIDITYLITGIENNALSVDQILIECPIGKRYDLEQLIRYASKLVKDNNEDNK